MNSKEEIEKEAMQVAGVHPDWSNFECFRMGFREGAKFADKTMLDRACEWLQLDEETKRLRYPLNQLNESLRKQAGEVNTEWYHAICWCKDNLSDIDYREIYGIAGGKRQALVELQYAIKEIKKGKINQPGAFILSKLRKL